MKKMLAAASVLLLAGCGIPLDDAPREPDNPRPYRSGTATAPGVGSALERLCLVKDDKIARTLRRVATARTPAEQLLDLFGGPNAGEQADGYTSALAGTGITPRLSLEGAAATVEIGDWAEHGNRSDEVLAFGQIVCTLTTRPEIGTVRFTSGGEPLSVPRADLSLSDGPLTIVDYDDLIAS
ncbi:GerMN domain-containing protein [Catenuloplanes japonicus]|uniref:GerMN domain-containing protein n=1 Tax=Catenuloplanes japonicus TaxID=33876 RepID=UPI0005240143|nr:GerMN domain-containing protein [Catenuloplanes japonicus]